MIDLYGTILGSYTFEFKAGQGVSNIFFLFFFECTMIDCRPAVLSDDSSVSHSFCSIKIIIRYIQLLFDHDQIQRQ